jgi:hypothetical protein
LASQGREVSLTMASVTPDSAESLSCSQFGKKRQSDSASSGSYRIMSHSKSEEISKNLERFLQALPALVPDHEGQYALIKDGSIQEFFDSAMDAQIAGNQRFDDQIFSIQCVKEEAEELGYFSYAVDPRRS